MVDVNEVIQEMVVMLQKEATRHSVTMSTDLAQRAYQGDGGSCAIATGIIESHAQWH